MSQASATILEREAIGPWAAYRADFARYRLHRPGTPTLMLLVTEQGLWALFQYRMASGLHVSRLPHPVKRPLLLACGVWQKLVEMATGICLPYRARIGPGLYIGHFGNVILHEDVVVGHTCNLSQGVTLGSSGRGAAKGVPVIGDRVYVAANATIAGRITVGDCAVVAANSLATRDVPAHTTVMGVPATPVGSRGSEGYIEPWPPPGEASSVPCRAARPTATA